LSDAELGEGSIGEPIVHTIDFLPNLKIGHVFAVRGHDPGKFVRWNRKMARLTAFRLGRWISEQLGRCYARCINPDQQFSGPRLGCGLPASINRGF
jgi:hypothetical protein